MSTSAQLEPKNIQLDKVLKKLPKGKVAFTYLTADGRLRDAIGTLNLGLIPADKMPKGEERANTECRTYFDFTVNDWRCFRYDRFVGKI